jgi:hypothetical protein
MTLDSLLSDLMGILEPHPQTSSWPAGRREPPTASPRLRECARVTLSVSSCFLLVSGRS